MYKRMHERTKSQNDLGIDRVKAGERERVECSAI